MYPLGVWLQKNNHGSGALTQTSSDSGTPVRRRAPRFVSARGSHYTFTGFGVLERYLTCNRSFPFCSLRLLLDYIF